MTDKPVKYFIIPKVTYANEVRQMWREMYQNRVFNYGLDYPIVRNGLLNLHVAMRSNNMTTTVNYDLYNFIGVQKKLLEMLRAEGLNVELGRYFHVCASAHILKDEIELAKAISN